MSREMKNSGAPWVGDIPNEWHTQHFKYAGSLQKGKLPESTNIDGIGLPIIGASEMLGKEARQFSVDEGLPTCNRNDILVLWDGANAGITATKLCGIVSSTASRYTCTDKKCDTTYVAYLFKVAESYFRDKVFGTTIPHMNTDYIDDFPMLVPSLSEQKAIADFLDKKCAEIDEMIALQEKNIEELKAYKQSVITEAVTKGLNPDVPMKDSGVEWMGEIPEKWLINRLKFLCDIGTGNQDTQDADKNGLYYFYVRSPLVERSNSFSFEGEGILMAGDGAGAGRVFHHAFGKYAVHQRVYRLSDFTSTINTDYLFYYLSSLFPNEMDRGSAQSTVPSVRLPMLLNFPICVPSPKEQTEIVLHLINACVKIDSLIQLKLSKIDSLKEYKKSIIYEYVTGKKEVEA